MTRGSVLSSGAGNAPQRRSGRAQALAHAQNQPAQNQDGKAQPRTRCRAAAATSSTPLKVQAAMPHSHGDLGPCAVRDAPRPRTASQCGDVLDADHQSGQRRAVAHAKVNIRRQNGQRQTDGEVADKSEVSEADNMPCAAAGGSSRRGSGAVNCSILHVLGQEPAELSGHFPLYRRRCVRTLLSGRIR